MRTYRYHFLYPITIKRMNIIIRHHLEQELIARLRAGSPVHISSLPSIANLIPTLSSICTKALVIFCARWSKLPAQPTQKSTSGFRC